MVVGVRYRDGKSATKAHAILRPLDSNSVVAIFVHVAGLPARAQTYKFCSCPLRSNNDHFCVGAAHDAKGQTRKAPPIRSLRWRGPALSLADPIRVSWRISS